MNKYIEDMKRRAKNLARKSDIKHTQALNHIAGSQGFSHWGALLKEYEQQEEATVVLRSVRMIGEESIAQIIQRLVDDLYAGMEQTKLNCTSIINTRKAEIRTEDTKVDPTLLPISGLLSKVQKDLQTIERYIEIEPRDIGLTSYNRDGNTMTMLQIKFSGGLMWSSQKTSAGITHTLEPRNGIPLALYLPDTPDCWMAAHNWAVQCREHTEFIDPISWGFRPSSLAIVPNGWTSGGVIGCHYAIAELEDFKDKFKENERAQATGHWTWIKNGDHIMNSSSFMDNED